MSTKAKVEVVAGVIEHDGKILCMQRNNSKHDYIAYKWEFPGGKIEEGETHAQTLARELEEEMGYVVDIKDMLIKVVHEYPDFILTMNAYNCVADNTDFVLKEHVDSKWLELEELKSLDWAAADIPIVDRLLEREHEYTK